MNRFTLSVGLVACFFVASSCSKEETIDETYIPFLNRAEWLDTSRPDYTFVFNPDANNTGKSSGVFPGEERQNGTRVATLQGSFNNRNITLVVQRASGNVTLNGRFLSDDVIDFGTFRLVPPTSY